MPDDKHLHIDQKDAPAEWASAALSCARSGAITIDFEGETAVQIAAVDGQIAVNLLRPTVFRVPEDETGLLDKLKTASEFGHKLSERGVTLYFLRRGKEAVRLGMNAHPVFSKLITKSGDIQLSSIRELARLKGDLKTG